jgi:hypothetical protein
MPMAADLGRSMASPKSRQAPERRRKRRSADEANREGESMAVGVVPGTVERRWAAWLAFDADGRDDLDAPATPLGDMQDRTENTSQATGRKK